MESSKGRLLLFDGGRFVPAERCESLRVGSDQPHFRSPIWMLRRCWSGHERFALSDEIRNRTAGKTGTNGAGFAVPHRSEDVVVGDEDLWRSVVLSAFAMMLAVLSMVLVVVTVVLPMVLVVVSRVLALVLVMVSMVFAVVHVTLAVVVVVFTPGVFGRMRAFRGTAGGDHTNETNLFQHNFLLCLLVAGH